MTRHQEVYNEDYALSACKCRAHWLCNLRVECAERVCGMCVLCVVVNCCVCVCRYVLGWCAMCGVCSLVVVLSV